MITERVLGGNVRRSFLQTLLVGVGGAVCWVCFPDLMDGRLRREMIVQFKVAEVKLAGVRMTRRFIVRGGRMCIHTMPHFKLERCQVAAQYGNQHA